MSNAGTDRFEPGAAGSFAGRAARALACLAAALLAACASSPSSRVSVIFLQSEGYACGAQPGLGCGLALAPALTTLLTVPGVVQASVTWDGRFFRIAIADGADPERVALAVGEVLEGEEQRVEAEATPGLGDGPWWDARGTIELSRHEAGVLAARFGTRIAEEAKLDASDRQRLETALREAFTGAFERAHAAGGGVHRLWEQFSAARAGFEARLSFLTDAQRASVSASLDRIRDES